MTDRNIWTPTFTAALNAIFDAAEADLRALGFGEIERGKIEIRLATRWAPRIVLSLDTLRAGALLRVEVTGSHISARSGPNLESLSEQLAEARRSLAVVELADRWVQRWGSMRWTEAEVYDAEAMAEAQSEWDRKRKIDSAVSLMTDRRREVLFKARDGEALTTADKRVAKSIPELVDGGVVTPLGLAVVARLRESKP